MRNLFSRDILAVVILAFSLVAASTATKSGDVIQAWRVLELSGNAKGRLDDAPFHALAAGEELPPGTEVVTDPSGRMTIAHGKDRLTVSPATQLQIARPIPGTVWDRLLQSFGSVVYDVEPRKDRTFGVDAPYLAAVVKGTKFKVTVQRDLASVHVERGRVEVTSSDGVAKVLLQAGQTATASPTQFHGLQLSSADGLIDTETLNAELAPVEGSPVGGTTVGGAATGATNVVGGTVAAVGGVVTGTANALGDTVAGAVSAVSGTVDSTVGAVGGVVGSATSAVGGVVGGLTGASSSGASTTSSSTTSTSTTGSSHGGLGGLLGGLL